MSLIARDLEPILLNRVIEQKHKKKKLVIVLLGARQVGKTTLMNRLAEQIGEKSLYWNCDESDIRQMLEGSNSTQLRRMIGNHDLLMIDEAQRVNGIGLCLKIIADMLPTVQLIVSGSSSLELSRSVNEPLTGRKLEYHVFPLSSRELSQNSSALEEQRLLEHRMVYGFYPHITQEHGEEKTLLKNLVQSYLYRDIFSQQEIRKPENLERLVRALALQVGNECSYNELARTTAINKETVMRYLSLLEQSFVVFRLGAFSRNHRKELVRGQKYYFYDNGILNTILQNYQSPGVRRDVGALWENFLMSERLKYRSLFQPHYNRYFWRTIDKQELDYIEEEEGELKGFEFKWNPLAKQRTPLGFRGSYPDAEVSFIHRNNYWRFVTGEG